MSERKGAAVPGRMSEYPCEPKGAPPSFLGRRSSVRTGVTRPPGISAIQRRTPSPLGATDSPCLAALQRRPGHLCFSASFA